MTGVQTCALPISGSVYQDGSGALVLAGTANTFSGSLNVQGGGVLADANAGAFPSAAGLGVGSTAQVDINYNETVRNLYGMGVPGQTGTPPPAGTVLLAQGATLTLASGGNFSGVLAGAGSLSLPTKAFLQLTGSNTYTGGTFLAAASVLEVGTSSGGGSLAGPVTDNGNLQFYTTGPASFTGGVSGTGVLVVLGTGTLTLGGANTYSGGTSVGPGATLADAGSGSFTPNTGITLQGPGSVLQVAYNEFIRSLNTPSGTSGTGGGSGALVTLASGATLDLTGGGTHTYAGSINGGGSLEYSGTGTEILTGANSYAGGTTVNSGILVADTPDGDSTGSGPLTIGPNGTLQLGQGDSSGGITGPITDNGIFNINRSDDIIQPSDSPISGSGIVEIYGGGTVTIPIANTYTGQTNVANGGLILANTAGSATGTGPVAVYNQAFLAGIGSIAGPLTLYYGSGLSPGTVPTSTSQGWKPGIINAGSTTLEGGGVEVYQMLSAAGTAGSAGTATSLLNVNGTLGVASTPAQPYTFILLTPPATVT